MEIGLTQYSPVWENPEASSKKIDKLISSRAKKIDLLIFPEMTLTGYTMKSDEFAEKIDGYSTQYFLKLAQSLEIDLIAGIIEHAENKIFNTAIHVDKNGSIVTRYRKIHPFSYAKEDNHYAAGNEIQISEINDVKLGLTICYDLRFPELYRLYGKERTDVLINIANWPVPRIDHWNHLLKARAIENSCFSVGVNRVGSDPFLNYCGCSAVYSPTGNELLKTDDSENLFVIDIDLSEVDSVRDKFNFLDDIKLI